MMSTEAIIEIIAYNHEYLLLSANAIPHKTPLNPKMPILTKLSGKDNPKAKSMPINEPMNA